MPRGGLPLLGFTLVFTLVLGNEFADEFQVFAPFSDGDEIALKHTCNGINESPYLWWTGAPAGTKSYAIMMRDTQGAKGERVHWLGWGLDETQTTLDQGQRTPVMGTTDFPNTGGYRGPCLQTGQRHRFRIFVHALSIGPEVERTSPLTTYKEFKAVVKEHMLATTNLSFVVTGHTFGSEDAHEAIRAEASQGSTGPVPDPIPTQVEPKRKSSRKGNPKLKTTLDSDFLCYACSIVVEKAHQLAKAKTKRDVPQLPQVDCTEAVEEVCEQTHLSKYGFPPDQMARACLFMRQEFDEELEAAIKNVWAEMELIHYFCRETTHICDGYTDEDIIQIGVNGPPSDAVDQHGRKWQKTMLNNKRDDL